MRDRDREQSGAVALAHVGARLMAIADDRRNGMSAAGRAEARRAGAEIMLQVEADEAARRKHVVRACAIAALDLTLEFLARDRVDLQGGGSLTR